MSINLHLEASTIAILELSNGKKKRKEIIERFELRQTPTNITNKCLDGKNTYELYKEWVMGRALPEKVYIYKEDDMFGEGEPIGYRMYDSEKVHIEELEDWLEDHNGWEIEWSAM